MSKIKDILIVIIGILLFLISYNFDQQVNMFFKSTRLQILDVISSIVTNFSIVIMLMLIVPIIILYIQGKNKKIIYIMLSTFIASFILAFVIKLIVLRQRPIDAFAFPFTNIINYSFPSMHSMVAFALLPVLIKHLPRYRYFWIVFAVFVIFSRIYFGFHFLSDVVFGALFGYFVGSWMMELYERKINGNK